MLRKINDWLNNHYFLWEEDDNEGCVRIVSFAVTLVLFMVLGLTKCLPVDKTIQLWAGIVAIAPPVAAAIEAVVRRRKWNPWYWFPILKGGVIGGLIAMLIVYLCRNLFGC